jgi:hypothetical protein
MACIRCPTLPTASAADWTGTAFSQTANTTSSSTPATNSGTDDNVINAIVMARSLRLPSR